MTQVVIEPIRMRQDGVRYWSAGDYLICRREKQPTIMSILLDIRATPLGFTVTIIAATPGPMAWADIGLSRCDERQQTNGSY